MDSIGRLKDELGDVVDRMKPSARAVFEELQNGDGLAEPELAEGFDALTGVESAGVTEAAQLLEKICAEEEATARRLSRRRRRLWIGSILFSFTCMIALSGILIHVYSAPTKPDPADTVVTTQDDVTRYMATHVPTPMPGSQVPIFIPTGLFVTSLEFTGPYTLEVSGQVWQRYKKNLPQDITKGIFLPLAEEQPTFKELYREQRGDEEVIGWTFHASMREQFGYSRYPMGRHQIRLRMYHPDFENNVYLTPDLAAYDPIDPAAVPGVDPVMILENWDIQQAFFSYRTHALNTNFGTSTYGAKQRHPELYYNIAVRRHLLSPLISRTIVPVVILIQLFVVVMVLGKDSERLEAFGVRPGTLFSRERPFSSPFSSAIMHCATKCAPRASSI